MPFNTSYLCSCQVSGKYLVDKMYYLILQWMKIYSELRDFYFILIILTTQEKQAKKNACDSISKGLEFNNMRI